MWCLRFNKTAAHKYFAPEIKTFFYVIAENYTPYKLILF